MGLLRAIHDLRWQERGLPKVTSRRSTSRPQETPALVAQGLQKGFRRGWLRRRFWALAGVDIVIPTGGITALVGPNAAGKSTLMRNWVGFEKPSRGTVRVLGHDPWRDSTAARTQLGYIPQSPALHPQLSAEDYLELAMRWRPSFDRDVAAAQLIAASVDLHAPSGQLSGGQQAQVALALALGTRADVLLLDEPLAQLDPLSRRDFLRIVADDSRSRGTTVVLSSHIVSDIANVCDSLVVLGNGRVLVHESIAAILRTHSVVPRPEDADGSAVRIAAIEPTGGSTLVSHDDDDRRGARPATLDEVVLGLLQVVRDEGQSRASIHA